MTKLHDQIAQYLDFCEFNRGFTEQTMSSRRYILRAFAKSAGVSTMEDFTVSKFSEWATAVRERTSAATMNHHIKIVRAFVRWLKEAEICAVPATLPYLTTVKTIPKKAVYFSREEIEKVAMLAKPLTGLMIIFMFETGLRISEFRNLRVRDVDLDGRTISFVGKGRKRGFVFLTAKTAEMVADYIARRGLDDDDFLWKTSRSSGGAYSVCRIRHYLNEAFSRAGYPDFHPHALRHSFATELIQSGLGIREVQRLLRHDDLNTTERYIHDLDRAESMRDVFDRARDSLLYKSP